MEDLRNHQSKNVCFKYCLSCNVIVRGINTWLQHQTEHMYKMSGKTKNIEKERLKPKRKRQETPNQTKPKLNCHHCNRTFSRLRNKIAHEKFKHCEICQRYFDTRGQLITHHFQHHKYIFWHCTICTIFETDNQQKAIEHEQNEHHCGRCHRGYFKNRGRKDAHIERKHPGHIKWKTRLIKRWQKDEKKTILLLPGKYGFEFDLLDT